VLLSDQSERLPALEAAVIGRPQPEPDLVAVQRALQDTWVVGIDPDRTVRAIHAIGSSRLLLGRSHEVGYTWQIMLSQALAQRRGLDEPDQRCWIAATIALSTFGEAVTGWVRDGCPGTADAVDTTFATLHQVCRNTVSRRSSR